MENILSIIEQNRETIITMLAGAGVIIFIQYVTPLVAIIKQRNGGNEDESEDANKEWRAAIGTMAETVSLSIKQQEQTVKSIEQMTLISTQNYEENKRRNEEQSQQHQLQTETLKELVSTMNLHNDKAQEANAKMTRSIDKNTNVSEQMLAEIRSLKAELHTLAQEMVTLSSKFQSEIGGIRDNGVPLAEQDRNRIDALLEQMAKVESAISNLEVEKETTKGT
jgi:hypothetical protein